MIYGTGIDLADIRRFVKWLDDDRLSARYFAEEELEFIRSRGKGSAASMAAGFAAKEALGKALGTGLSGLNLKGIAVLRDGKGKPYFRFGEKIGEKLAACGENPVVHLSLTHESDWAMAQVIIEVENGRDS